MIQYIPVSKTPNQIFKIDLNNQNCTIQLFQKYNGLYFSLWVDEIPILYSVICQNANPLVMFDYIGFNGNLFFIDLEGEEDPTYDLLGERYLFVYTDEL